ncbi:MAG: peptidylprolyl isomerase [Pseudomonadales bacterium]|nr:peptidylprolyl isomerase [Pseudomonadales bacterium]
MAGRKEKESAQEQELLIGDDMVVAFHYRLGVVDDEGKVRSWLEDSSGRNPLLYLHGHGNVVSGLEAALAGKKTGDLVEVTLKPEQAYGMRNPDAIQRLPMKKVTQKKGQQKVAPGMIVALKTKLGQKNAVVVKVGRHTIDVDTNHPYAGHTLHYQIQVAGIRAASAEEIAHGHVHGPDGVQHG